MKRLVVFLYVWVAGACFCVGAQQSVVTSQLRDVAVHCLESQSRPEGSSCITENEWNDLACDQVLSRCDRTITAFGSWGLRQLLWPVADRAEVEARQVWVKQLVENQELFDAVEHCLRTLAEDQEHILAYWEERNTFLAQFEQLYFHVGESFFPKLTKALNSSRRMLGLSTTNQLVMGLYAVFDILFFHGEVSETAEKGFFSADFSLESALKRGLAAPFQWHKVHSDRFLHQVDLYDDSFFIDPSFGSTYNFCCCKGFSNVFSLLAASAVVAIQDYTLANGLYRSGTTFVNYLNTTNDLQQHMAAVARIKKTVQKIARELEGSAGRAASLSVSRRLGGTSLAGSKVQQLWRLLDGHTFSGNKTGAYSRGNVLYAHHLLQENKHDLVPVLRAVAELDAYFSLARLYKERKGTHAPFCFASWVETPKTSVDVHDVWSPAMDPGCMVGNTLEWGCNGQPNKVIITGPNGAGKSMGMKSVALSVLLGQSWGIVPATQATLSWCDVLRTDCSPREDSTQNLSTFMAEKQRMDALDAFLTHNSKARVLIVLDEPLHGTIGQEASRRLKKFCHTWAEADQSLLLIATHLSGAIAIPQELPQSFVNYHVGIHAIDGGRFERLFTLKEGPATWWFNDAEKRGAFIDQLLKE